MQKLKMLREVYKPKESEIKRSVRKYLALRGIFNWNQWQGQFSVKGVPDIVGIIPGSGKLLGIEVKCPGKKPRPEQQAFLDEIKRNGGIAFVVTSVEELVQNLQCYGGPSKC
jgi:hypothetical protein